MLVENKTKRMLKNIKLAVFDFDDTLAIHKDPNYVEHRKTNEDNYFIQAYQNPNEFYTTIEPCDPSEDMRNLVLYCRFREVPMLVLSGMRFSLHANAKQSFINRYYGEDIQLLTAASQERKEDVVRLLMKAHKLKPEEIPFVDDIRANVQRMAELGVTAFHVSEISTSEINPGETLKNFADD